jgi:hypothetical protein
MASEPRRLPDQGPLGGIVIDDQESQRVPFVAACRIRSVTNWSGTD